MPVVNVIIPNLDGEKLLPMTLETLRSQTFQDFDVTVVDNGSRDSSIELLSTKYPEVNVLPLGTNTGFAAAVNRGIQATKGEFVCLLNNDMELDARWLEHLCQAMFDHPEVSACNPKVMRYWERERINVLGIKLHSSGEVGIIGAGETDRGQYNQMRYVFGVNAGAALYRRSMFDTVGLFDEVFFASYEDADLSFRAQLLGLKALYVPEALVYHMVGATIKRKKFLPTYFNNRNKLLFFWKNMPLELIKRHFWKIVGYWSLTFAKRVFLNFYKLRTLYYLRGIVAAHAQIPYILRERRAVQNSRTVSIDYLDSLLDKDFV